MRLETVRRPLCASLVAFLPLAFATVAGAEPGVLIALDSSRSLSAQQSRNAAALARDLVVRLAATAPASVLTFDDSVHWLARAGEGGAEAALDALVPTGRNTVLNDGLIEGVRALPQGGVLVLISDGMDENSATTLEDVVRLASERNVRIVTVGAGRVDERTLRRLALLTEGLYSGEATRGDPDALAAEIEALRREVAAEAAPPAVAAPPSAPAPEVAAPAPAPAEPSARPLLLVGALVAAVGIVIGFLLARRRAPAEPEVEYELPEPTTKPGVPVPEPAVAHVAAPAAAPEATPIDEVQLARLRGRPAVPPGGLLEISLDDTAAFQRLPFSESIERTLVITEEVVLKVREPGHDARTFRVPPGRAIDVGRDSKRNTLAFHDPTMSVQHLRLALDEGEAFLLDLGSTNGVLHNGRRVHSTRIEPGDRFRAGMIEFELVLHRASAS
jgi:hypothetical protein